MNKSPVQQIKDKLKGYSRLIALLIIIILIVSLIRNIRRTLDAEERIGKKEERVEQLRRQNEELKQKLENITSDEFAERQLRDQLGFAKEGEIVVVLPEEDVLRALVPDLDEEPEKLPEPFWRRWADLFDL